MELVNESGRNLAQMDCCGVQGHTRYSLKVECDSLADGHPRVGQGVVL